MSHFVSSWTGMTHQHKFENDPCNLLEIRLNKSSCRKKRLPADWTYWINAKTVQWSSVIGMTVRTIYHRISILVSDPIKIQPVILSF
jgi:hypothetical protein